MEWNLPVIIEHFAALITDENENEKGVDLGLISTDDEESFSVELRATGAVFVRKRIGCIA